MAKLGKPLNETVEEILKISPKMTVAKIASMLGVNSRCVNRTDAWKNRKKGGGGRRKRVRLDDYDL